MESLGGTCLFITLDDETNCTFQIWLSFRSSSCGTVSAY